jgi:hypothetical protein
VLNVVSHPNRNTCRCVSSWVFCHAELTFGSPLPSIFMKP